MAKRRRSRAGRSLKILWYLGVINSIAITGILVGGAIWILRSAFA